MDERERMRAVLAEKAMGYEPCVCRRLHGEPEPCWKTQDMGRRIVQTDWHPDINWSQCGMVVEAMRAKEWNIEAYMNVKQASVSFTRTDKDCYGEAEAPTFTEAVSLAAFRALEATDD